MFSTSGYTRFRFICIFRAQQQTKGQGIGSSRCGRESFLVACGGATTTSSPPTATTGTTATTSPQDVQVKIGEKNNQYSFEPATITVPKGTKVTWTNGSDAPHTITSDTNVFNTPSSLAQNQTFSMTFTKAGTYSYHCTIHTYMKATIIVT